jgi:SHS2 domain-containing protein
MRVGSGSNPQFEYFPVTADQGLRAWGKDLGEAYINAARGMFHLMIDSAGLSPSESRRVKVEAEDRESLLVAWLSELLYLYEVEGFLPLDYEIIQGGDQCLDVHLRGVIVDPMVHDLRGAVKAATYHLLEVKQERGKWFVQVVLDM